MAKSPRQRRTPKPGFFARHPVREAATEDQLRQLFTEARILERAEAGELVQEIAKDGQFIVKLDDEEDFVKTRLVKFSTLQGQEICRAHCYLRRDGSIAASGKLDPKEILHNGTFYFKP